MKSFIWYIISLATSFSLPVLAVLGERQAQGTTAIGLACGKSGFYECGVEYSGGCCPIGLICDISACLNKTATSTEPPIACPGYNGYFACPTALGDGCCPGGYVCDEVVDCRLTLKLSIATKLSTITEMSGSVPVGTHVLISESVIGDGVTAVGRIGTVSSASNTTTESAGQGLTAGQISGIVVGIVGFLALSGLTGYFVLRRRRRQRGAGSPTEGSADYAKAELEAKPIQLSELQSKTDVSELPAITIPQELGDEIREVYELEGEHRIRAGGPQTRGTD